MPELSVEDDGRLVELVRMYVEERGFSPDGLSLYQKIAPLFPGWTFQSLRKYYLKTLRMGRESLSSEPVLSGQGQGKPQPHVQTQHMESDESDEPDGEGGDGAQSLQVETGPEEIASKIKDSTFTAELAAAPIVEELEEKAAPIDEELEEKAAPIGEEVEEKGVPIGEELEEKAAPIDEEVEEKKTLLVDEALEFEFNLSALNAIKPSQLSISSKAEPPTSDQPPIPQIDKQESPQSTPSPQDSDRTNVKKRRTAKKTSQSVDRRTSPGETGSRENEEGNPNVQHPPMTDRLTPKDDNRNLIASLPTPRVSQDTCRQSLECIELLMKLTREPKSVIIHALLIHSGAIIPAYQYLTGRPTVGESAWTFEDDMAILRRDEKQMKTILEQRKTLAEITFRYKFLNELCDAPP